MRLLSKLVTLCGLAMASPTLVSAQLGGLPQVQIPDVARTLPDVPPVDIKPLISNTESLANMRLDRIADFVRANRSVVEVDRNGQPAVRGILIALGVDDAMIARAAGKEFALLDQEKIEGLGLSIARFRIPDGRSIARAQKQLAKLLPDAQVDVDNLYFTSGPGGALPGAVLAIATPTASVPLTLGLVDGGVAAHPSVAGRVDQRGFASGAPLASRHGTAVASLMIGKGAVRGAAPGALLLAADVYGKDPAGGSATAIARALGWLASRRVPVTTISLVGPDNKLLKAAISRAQGRGMLIVAAVGNDGPAAPPSFPASYKGVLAVTGVDARDHALPEAGRATHVDFAAPGDGVLMATGATATDRLRGTSFAAPLVAGRLARYYPRASIGNIETAVRALIAEARDLGKKGRDPLYGYGLICGTCAIR